MDVTKGEGLLGQPTSRQKKNKERRGIRIRTCLAHQAHLCPHDTKGEE